MGASWAPRPGCSRRGERASYPAGTGVEWPRIFPALPGHPSITCLHHGCTPSGLLVSSATPTRPQPFHPPTHPSHHHHHHCHVLSPPRPTPPRLPSPSLPHLTLNPHPPHTPALHPPPPTPPPSAGPWSSPRRSRCWTSWSGLWGGRATPTTAWTAPPPWPCAPASSMTSTTTMRVGHCRLAQWLLWGRRVYSQAPCLVATRRQVVRLH